MDGAFVPPISAGPPIIQRLRPVTPTTFFDVHDDGIPGPAAGRLCRCRGRQSQSPCGMSFAAGALPAPYPAAGLKIGADLAGHPGGGGFPLIFPWWTWC